MYVRSPTGYELVPYQPQFQPQFQPLVQPLVQSAPKRTIRTTPEFLGYATCADVNQEGDAGNRLRLCNALKTRSGARRCQYDVRAERCSNASSAIMQSLDDLDQADDPAKAKVALARLSRLANQSQKMIKKSPSLVSDELEGYLHDIDEQPGNVFDIFTGILRFIKNTVGSDNTSYLWKLVKMVFMAWLVKGAITIGPIKTMIKLLQVVLPDGALGLVHQETKNTDWYGINRIARGIEILSYFGFSILPALKTLWWVSGLFSPASTAATVARVIITSVVSWALAPNSNSAGMQFVKSMFGLREIRDRIDNAIEGFFNP